MIRRKPRTDQYKSNFERDVHAYYGNKIKYEADKITFTQPAVSRYYLPDFKVYKNIYLETKGKLTLEDRKKHQWIKEQHPEILIIFIFMNSRNTITRKSKTTYGDWADEVGIPYYCWRNNPPPKDIKEFKSLKSINVLKQTMGKSDSKENSPKKKSTSASSLQSIISLPEE